MDIFFTDWYECDAEVKIGGNIRPTRHYTIYGFGYGGNGKKTTAIIRDYQPRLYIQLPYEGTGGWKVERKGKGKERYECPQLDRFLEEMTKSDTRGGIDVKSYQLVEGKSLYGFTGEDKFWFAKLLFDTLSSYNKCKNYLKKCKKVGLFEAGLPPLLSFLHECDIPSSGWTHIGEYTDNKKGGDGDEEDEIDEIVGRRDTGGAGGGDGKSISIDECEILVESYKSLTNVEKGGPPRPIPPLDIISFDIEADSSHGDFPIGKKDYKKLAANICDEWKKMTAQSNPCIVYHPREVLFEWISLAFNQKYDRQSVSHVTFVDDVRADSKTLDKWCEWWTTLDEEERVDIDFLACKLKEMLPPVDLTRSLSTHWKFATQMVGEIERMRRTNSLVWRRYGEKENVRFMLRLAYEMMWYDDNDIHRVYTKEGKRPKTADITGVASALYRILRENGEGGVDRDSIVELFNSRFPPVEGDRVVQIGVVAQRQGEKHPYLKHIITLESCSPIENKSLIWHENAHLEFDGVRGEEERLEKARERASEQEREDRAKVVVQSFTTEREVLLAFTDLMRDINPDVVIGYNIFGFDMEFLKIRAEENKCLDEFMQMSRINGMVCKYVTQELNSSGLGQNKLQYISMPGRVLIDLYKVFQAAVNIKLDSYGLDTVAHTFLKQRKNDMPPQMLFIKQRGSGDDRREIAEYCIIDCILCNRLLSKFEFVNNNIQMAKVCNVPLDYLFRRGQGIKILSFISKICKNDGYYIPYLDRDEIDASDAYEGAIVLDPEVGIYYDPIAVCDFNSLYPSSMISRNLSHDAIVEIGGKYDNLPEYDYVDVEYDNFKIVETQTGRATKRTKVPLGKKVCRFVKFKDGHKSIIPRVLMDLLKARKGAKKEMEKYKKGSFEYSLYEGLQQAYKVIANSLYGQCGAKTSHIYMKDIAACTTATGREMIMFSKAFVEKNYPGAKVIYGDTDSIFIRFDTSPFRGLDAVFRSITLASEAAKLISMQLEKPQNLEFEKAIWPFCIISAKRYHGHYYTKYGNPSYYPNSMGIVLKRRDNAPIVKHVYGGMMDILMKDHSPEKAWRFIETELGKLRRGEFPIDMLVVSKTLGSTEGYKMPEKIAHWVLAQRMVERDPGNRPQTNDRIPFVYVQTKGEVKLQGDRIEHPKYIAAHPEIKPDYEHYLTNQIMKPVMQVIQLADKSIMGRFERILLSFRLQKQGIDWDKMIKESADRAEMVISREIKKQNIQKIYRSVMETDDKADDEKVEDYGFVI